MESVRLEGWQGPDHEGFVGRSAEFDLLMVDTAGHPQILLQSRVLLPPNLLAGALVADGS